MKIEKQIPGLPAFAAIPAVAALDPRLTPRSLRVLLILSLHAKNGRVEMCQDRIAELLGLYYLKDGVRVPHRPHISKELTNLEKLGYLKRDKKQLGINQIKPLTLTLPPVSLDGSTVGSGTAKVNLPAFRSRKESNAQYFSKKAIERARHYRSVTNIEQFQDELESVSSLSSTSDFDDLSSSDLDDPSRPTYQLDSRLDDFDGVISNPADYQYYSHDFSRLFSTQPIV